MTKPINDSKRIAGLVVACFLFLRATPAENDFVGLAVMDDEETDFNRIRCPLCRWQPDASSLWVCCDCDEPEYFYGGCETWWNTFDTGGRCPGCQHQWRWTSCLACEGWSPHADWYEKK
jgi:hypothetical protein